MLKVPTQDLVDGVKRATFHPDTFAIPTAIERTGLRVDDFAKVGFEGTATKGGEKFWTQVVEVKDGPRYVVRIDNDLVYTAGHGISYNDLIEVEPRHILSVSVPPPSANPNLIASVH